jgi:DNA-binding MarR family transcriptional regulator
VTLPMITIMADRLVELGYVERVQHATDNRMKYLQTSPYGLERIKKIESEIRKNASPLLRGLGDADMEQLGRILDTIIGNSEAAQ